MNPAKLSFLQIWGILFGTKNCSHCLPFKLLKIRTIILFVSFAFLTISFFKLLENLIEPTLCPLLGLRSINVDIATDVLNREFLLSYNLLSLNGNIFFISAVSTVSAAGTSASKQMFRFSIEIVLGLAFVTAIALGPASEVVVLALGTDPPTIWKLEIWILLCLLPQLFLGLLRSLVLILGPLLWSHMLLVFFGLGTNNFFQLLADDIFRGDFFGLCWAGMFLELWVF